MDAAARHPSAAARPSVYWLSDHGGWHGGAATSMVKAIDRCCRERGWTLECGYSSSIARGRPWLEDLSAAGIAFELAPDGRRAKAGWLASKLDRLEGPAVLHTHFAGFDLAALAASRGRPATTIWHVHSILRGDPAHRLRSVVKYRWLSRRGVSRIVCVSDSAAESVLGRGAPKERITVVENGIDLNRFPPTTTGQRREARAALGVEGEDPVLLHFGWDWEVKGGALFMQALARLRAQGVPAKGLVIAGGDAFLDAARRLGMADSLLTVAPSENVRRFYDAADLLLATSPAEGGGPPLAVVEALSCGTPVIATDIEGHRPGGVAPPALHLVAAEAELIAGAAREVLAVPADEREAAAAATRQWVERERNIDVWAERMAVIYAEAFAGLR